jgi:hypothetical protein
MSNVVSARGGKESDRLNYRTSILNEAGNLREPNPTGAKAQLKDAVACAA